MNSYFLLETTGEISHHTNPGLTLLYLSFTITLAVLHIFVGKLACLERIIPKFRWISLGAGVSITYVFLVILPELSYAQVEINHVSILTYLENHVYILALLGLLVFYGLEILVLRTCSFSSLAKLRQNSLEASQPDNKISGFFLIHMGFFAVYNALIGDLLSKTEQSGLISAILFCVALALHFLVNDNSLREHHQGAYDLIGRWILAGALVCGWVIGQTVNLSPAIIAMIQAFIAGAIIMNVLKEEIPTEKDSCFWAFSVGLGFYAILLLLT